jgi:hypothetical protein
MRINISGILEGIERRAGHPPTARFKAGRCHHRWVNVEVELTDYQADVLSELIGVGQAYEYVFYDAVMEVWDYTGEHPKHRLKTFEDQHGRLIE